MANGIGGNGLNSRATWAKRAAGSGKLVLDACPPVVCGLQTRVSVAVAVAVAVPDNASATRVAAPRRDSRKPSAINCS
jgi:hypothetical protein